MIIHAGNCNLRAFALVASLLLSAHSWASAAPDDDPASPAVVVVRGTLSASSAAEQLLCSNTADRIGGWLADLSIDYAASSDEEVVAGALSEYALAIFPFNPYLPDEEVAAMATFVEGGGKLLLFYASSPQLASLLGLRVGGFTQDPSRTLFHVIRPAGAAPENWPERVGQQTPHVIPVFPTGAEAKVSAYWEDVRGNRTDTPAWVHSDRGAWMSYILLDGDAMAKKRMLLAWITHFLPDLAQDPPAPLERDVKDLFELVERAALADLSLGRYDRGQEKRISSKLKRADKEIKRLEKAMNKGKTHEALVRASTAKDLLFSVYGLLQFPITNEFRGVWDHTGLGLFPGDWERTCELLRDNGFTAVLPNMLSAGYAHYPSEILPASDAMKNHGDQVAAVVEAAGKNGLEVHIWKVCWQLVGAPDEFVERMRSRNRLQVDLSGESIPWLCPSDPANVDREIASVLEIALKYNVNGIHLDYVRYPDRRSCYCNGCRMRFQESAGVSIEEWPEEVADGEMAPRYSEWRADRISAFVERLHELLSGLRHPRQLSAAVFGHYDTAFQEVGQNWREWTKEGYLSFICPMNYTTELSFFKRLVDEQLPFMPASVGFYPGIGVGCETSLDPVQTIDQINELRQRSVRGFLLFDLTPSLADGILPVLRLGVTAE